MRDGVVYETLYTNNNTENYFIIPWFLRCHFYEISFF